MLDVQNISYSIHNKFLLENVSVQFRAGKLNLIIGPNGAGKSTLVKLISKQLKPHAGKLFFSGEDADSISIADMAKKRAVLSQTNEISFPVKVHELVMMGRYPHFSNQPEKKDIKACEESMQFFDIYNMRDRDFHSLSGGEKQRVHFARVLAQLWYPISSHFRYLILDEPLTFLDIHYQFEFMQRMKEFLKNEDVLVIGVVHDLNLAAKFADQITLLHHGKVIANGIAKEVLSKENIESVYQVDVEILEKGTTLHLIF